MELYGELYDCEELLDEYNAEYEDAERHWGGGHMNEDTTAQCAENEAHVKNIEVDIKSNQKNVSTQYLFLYINTFKQKNIKSEKTLYVVNFYDVHMKNDDKNVLDTEKDIVEYCLENVSRGKRRDRGGHDGDSNGDVDSDRASDRDDDAGSTSQRASKYYLFKIYETILKYFPFSFKLWYHYLKDRIELLSRIYYDEKEEYEDVNRVFDQCLLYMYHFKAIYILYIQFLFLQRKVQKIRLIFNLALQNISLNQHEDLWEYQLKYSNKIKNKLINYEYIKRFVTIYPENIVYLFNHYVKYKMCKHALNTFFYMISCDEEENLQLGDKSIYDLYKEMFQLISSRKILENDVLVTLRKNFHIFKRYENVTSIYTLLANSFVYEGRWNKAMDAYEEGILECYTVNDFAVLFEGYIETMKILIELKMRTGEGKEAGSGIEEGSEDRSDSGEGDEARSGPPLGEDTMVDLYMDKINYLLDKRKVFIADIKLKNNQKNVYVWIGKIDAVETAEEKVDLYNRCLKHFEDADYHGRLSDVYISYAYFHYNREEYDKAVNVFNRAVREHNFKTLNEISSVYCSWIEVELLEGNFKQALRIARLAIDLSNGGEGPRRSSMNNYTGANIYEERDSLIGRNRPIMRDNHLGSLNQNFNLLNNVKLACLILDLEINYGTIETSINLFDMLYHKKNITVRMVLSFANYLYENKYFSECFKTYEKALSIFHYPYLYPVYVHYINKYVERYKDKNISYVRELYRQAIYGTDEKTFIPKEFSKIVFLMYASFEENYGFLKRSLSIYKEAVPFLSEPDKVKFYKVFISKVSKSYGVHKAREAFEEAIQTLNDDDAREICLLYIDMEYKLNEYDRVRALYIYTAQFTNPSVHMSFYQDWREFEALHGNEHTFRDMIRIKRSVLSLFSNSRSGSKPLGMLENDDMNGLESTKRKLQEMIDNEEGAQKRVKVG
ncbi:hypothetical protein C922_03540 [Plasmodium inui San Antonio 1]|uniref:Pre-mRNA-splicing factor SYF1 n=1 Tax=Plasmodium inui San Antonio 1 TaxID=1237626 RepID=W7A334_9APIC|nr:hypothetical protein C922_03540 [Plasmodium inui San Antonio 1]EUD66070.1 hypothetical protein C922_03540 [Plasmodium inui San Antonio 1]